MVEASDLTGYVEGIVHEDTQVGDDGLDLTVAEVYLVGEPGRVDFGGGELEPAELEPCDKHWRNEDDDYQWWLLPAGTYLLEYNERVDADRRLVLQTRDAVRERGAFHPTLRAAEIERVPLTVGGGGILLKENARVSTLLAD